MPETIKVTLARIEERQIALSDKLDSHLETIHEKNNILDEDVSSLKQSRAAGRAIVLAIGAGLSWLGIDRFF